MTDLTSPIYNDETAARKHLEAIRWADGVVCPYCGCLRAAEIGGEKSLGDGWYHCPDCRKKFTVRVGTVYERSHIPLHKWVLATHLMSASKKGISAHQLHRMLGITYKSAWFMAMRIREAMAPHGAATPMGGEGKTVEIDETYIGGLEKNKHRNKRKTVRGRGGATSAPRRRSREPKASASPIGGLTQIRTAEQAVRFLLRKPRKNPKG